MRRLLFAVLSLVSVATLAASDDFDEEYEKKPWQELALRLPPAPDPTAQIPFYVSAATDNRFTLVPKLNVQVYNQGPGETINDQAANADAVLQHFRICNAKVGILLDGRTGHDLAHGQFVNCGYGVVMANSSSTLLRNALFSNVTTNLSGNTGTTVSGSTTVNDPPDAPEGPIVQTRWWLGEVCSDGDEASDSGSPAESVPVVSSVTSVVPLTGTASRTASVASSG